MIAGRLAGHVSDHIHLGLFKPISKPMSLSAAQEAMSSHHVEALGARNGETIVDVGAGFGGTLQLLDQKLSDAHLIGVNIEERQIHIARQLQFRNRVSWRCCDAACFSGCDMSWADRILSLEAFFHFPDPVGFFTASARALKTGGCLVMSTLLFVGQTPLTFLSRDVVTSGYHPWPFPELLLSDIRQFACDSGFVETHCEDLEGFCGPSFDYMSPECPKEITNNPVVELRRLFEMGCVRYPLLVFTRVST